MKVCIVTNGDLSRPTGVARYWGYLRDVLKRAGIPLAIVTPGEARGMADDEIAIGATETIVGIPDTVGAIAVQHGCAHTHLERDPSWGAGPALVKAHQAVARRPNTEWVACSDWSAHENRAAFGVTARRVIYGCVDTDAFRPGDRQLARDARRPVILHHCADSNKGAGKIDAIANALAGEFTVKRLNCPQDRVASEMRDADMWLCLSVSEGLPTVVQEAMATNLVVVGTNVGVLWTPFIGSQTGATVIPWQKRGHVEFVADNIRNAWAERAKTNGRLYAVRQWNVPQFEQPWLACVNEAIMMWGKA